MAQTATGSMLDRLKKGTFYQDEVDAIWSMFGEPAAQRLIKQLKNQGVKTT